MGPRFESQHDTKHLILCAPLLFFSPFVIFSRSLCFFSPQKKKYNSRDSLIHSSLHSIFRRLPNQTLITGFRPNLDLFPISLFLPRSRYTQFHWLLPRLRRVTPSLSSLPLTLHSPRDEFFTCSSLVSADFFARSVHRTLPARRRRWCWQISISEGGFLVLSLFFLR